MAYEINYDDQRFQDVEADKKQAISELDKTYGEMIGQTDSYYQAQINAAKDWEQKQTELQNQKTDFAIQEIEQQKTQAQKDYTKEQSGAYVDWRKQSNEYGAESEAMAAQGLQRTGYSESSQVSMYNTYQNRVATARESYNLAVQNYNNAITEARLQNNSALAEIAYNALQQQLELSLAGFQYKNQLLLEQANKKTDLENEYYARYQDVLSQINTENALAEQVRQYNEQMAEEKRQYDEQMAFQREQYEYQKAQTAARSSGGGGGGGSYRSSSNSSSGTTSVTKNSSSASVRDAVDTIVREGSNAGKTNNTVKSEVNKYLNAAVKDGTMTAKEAAAYKIAMRNQAF